MIGEEKMTKGNEKFFILVSKMECMEIGKTEQNGNFFV